MVRVRVLRTRLRRSLAIIVIPVQAQTCSTLRVLAEVQDYYTYNKKLSQQKVD